MEKAGFNWGGLVGGVGGSLLGMIGQNARAKKQQERQKELMNIQLENQKLLNKQGSDLQMDMWNKTNYGAQVDHMKNAGLNVGMMYGMGGGSGTTAGSQGGGSAQGGNAAAPMDIGASVQAGLMLAQTEKLKAETENLREDTSKKGVEQQSIKTGIDKLIAETNNENEKTALTRLQQALIMTDKNKREQEIQNLKSDQRLIEATRNLKISETERTNAETAIKQFDANTMVKYGMSNVDSPIMKLLLRTGNIGIEGIIEAIEFITGLKANRSTKGLGGAEILKK